MDIPRNILLERLELLETGKCYPASQKIPLKTRLYKKYLPQPRIYRTEADTGHIPFSQAVTLPFTPVSIGSSFGPLWATFWFKLEFELVDEVSDLHLIWDTESEALLYSDRGKPLQAFNGGNGDDRRAFCVIDGYARAYVYYLEVACSGMFGEGVYPEIDPNKHFPLKECRLGVFDRKMWDLMWDYQVLIEFARELKDTPRGETALFQANKVIDRFRTDPDTAVDDCLLITQEFLRDETAPKAATVLALGHCHIDTAWLWRYQETKRKVLRSWTTQLSLMDTYSDYSFCASAALHYQWMKEGNEERFVELRRRVEEGRWQVVGGAWVEFDGNLPGGEAMARQLLYGQLFFKKLFGETCKVFFLPDTFGYSSQLPQLIKSAGMPYFVTQKLSWNLINKFPHSSFQWRGLDGTSVLTHFPPADTYCAKASVSEILKSSTNNKEKGRFSSSLLLFGLGDGGGGPLPDHLERLKRVRNLHPLPRVETERLENLFQRMESADLPVWFGELYFELHRGTYTTMATVKKLNRVAESKLRQLELLATVSHSVSQDRITSLYKVLLQQQFHDVLPGSSIEAVYTDAIAAFTSLLQEVEELLKAEDHYGKVNLQSWGLEEVVQTGDDGDFVCVRAQPFASVQPFDSDESVQFTEIESGIILENSQLKVHITDSGLIASMVLKETGRECFSTPGNQLVIYDDLPFFWDAWDIEIYHSRSRTLANQKGTLVVSLRNPKRIDVQWRCSLTATSSISQTFSLTSLSPHLLISTDVTWDETHKALKAEFPTTLSPSALAQFECQFGHQSRPTHYNTSWDVAKFEVSAQRWMHLGEYNFGISVINDSKYGMNVHEGVMALTLLRSPKAPNPNADIGKHEFKYAVYPHAGDMQGSRLWELASALNTFSQVKVSERKEIWVEIAGKGLVVEAIKRAEDGNGLVLRAFETFGGSVEGRFRLNTEVFGHITAVSLVNILEESLAEVPVTSNAFVHSFQPFQILSFRITIA